MQSTISNKEYGDQLLWKNFQNNDRQAFALIYSRYFYVLFLNALRICGDEEMVKDCIHDLFITIWKNRKRLNIPRSVKAYLLSAVQRKIIRQIKKERLVSLMDNADESSVVHCVEKKIIAEQVYQQHKLYLNEALKTLTNRQKEAVYLKFYAEMSYAEIAGKMDITVDAIYNLVSKAINNMQGRLSKKMLYV